MTNTLKTAPAEEPITLSEAKTHLRVTATDEDTYITTLIQAARQIAETYTQRAFLTQTWQLQIDQFPCAIELAKSPIQTVTSIKYIDTDGVLQTITGTDYTVHAANEPGMIDPAYGLSWPAARTERNAVTIEYIAGWMQPQSVPAPIISAMLLIIGDLYRNREDVSPEENYILPNSEKSLLWPYRLKII